MAQFYGSANTGLGFFHIEVDKPAAVAWLNLDNVGIAVVDGDITMEELKQNFSEIWKTNWPWQMRQLEGNEFLVRFPPGIKVKDLVGFPSINLKKKGVSVSFTLWDGDVPVYSEMQEIWVKVEGIPPKYLSWRVMIRVATALGIPIDVDWHEIFRSFYRVLRLRVAVRDVSEVPSSRVMEFDRKMYLLSLSIIPDAVTGGNNDDGDDPGNDEAGGNVEKDKDEEHHLEGGRPMDTDQQGNATPAPTHLPLEVQVAKVCSRT
jgi:hypothetical protein